MRRLTSAVGIVCAVIALMGFADAQVNTMPGQVVGTGYGLGSVGNPVPKAAPPAGRPIGLPKDTAMVRRYDPNRPFDALKGTNLSRDQVAAPLSATGGDPSLWDQMQMALGFKKHPQVKSATPASTYFPSLTRRNRERAEAKQWRRD